MRRTPEHVHSVSFNEAFSFAVNVARRIGPRDAAEDLASEAVTALLANRTLDVDRQTEFFVAGPKLRKELETHVWKGLVHTTVTNCLWTMIKRRSKEADLISRLGAAADLDRDPAPASAENGSWVDRSTLDHLSESASRVVGEGPEAIGLPSQCPLCAANAKHRDSTCKHVTEARAVLDAYVMMLARACLEDQLQLDEESLLWPQALRTSLDAVGLSEWARSRNTYCGAWLLWEIIEDQLLDRLENPEVPLWAVQRIAVRGNQSKPGAPVRVAADAQLERMTSVLRDAGVPEELIEDAIAG